MNQLIPTEEECLHIMKQYHMLDNIKAHSIEVKNIALALYNNLIDQNPLNCDLVIAGALLHDIAKTWAIETGNRKHDIEGGAILRKMNLPDIAYIVESHVFFKDFVKEGPIEERELVFYADKRVMHDVIVSLDQRVEDLIIRYGRTEEIINIIKDNKNFVLEVEEKINRHSIKDIHSVINIL